MNNSIYLCAITLITNLRFFLSIKNLDREEYKERAVVTLVSGNDSGYMIGALALAQSLVNSNSSLRRVIMVTSDVPDSFRGVLRGMWDLVEVERINCVPSTTSLSILNKDFVSEVDDKVKFVYGVSEDYRQNLKRWSSTCTKFAAWTLTDFDQIIFMDSDMIVTGFIDNIFDENSKYPFYAAPEKFPPDTFNSGIILLSSISILANLIYNKNRVSSNKTLFGDI